VKLLRLLWHGLAIVGALGVIGAAWFASQGIGARPAPGPIETRVSRTARHFLVPAGARARTSPAPRTPDTLLAGMEHWADHCASCHANSGAGDTDLGRSLYPPPPDMRQAATQNLTDGELFYIIENGVKLTGMPAWGTGTDESARSSWHLVQFIRRLPSLSEAELAEMEELNPRGAAEWQALEEERRFLSGQTPLPVPDPATHDHKGVPQ
jgi:mono/diheme cytochrome c family protein